VALTWRRHWSVFLPGVIFLLTGAVILACWSVFVKFDFLPIPRNWIRWALAGYAALTSVIYVVMQIQSGGEFVSALGIVTLLVELVLIFLLAKEKV
jgi:hypothetical protein